MEIDAGGSTAVGSRAENQDRWAVADDGKWGAVSDGVGGAPGGARAAELTIDAVSRVLDARGSVADAFEAAHAAVVAEQLADHDRRRMAATLTVAVHVASSTWLVAAAGDSPGFLLGQGHRRLLAPHTLAEDLVAAGAISRAEGWVHPGRRRITRGIGHSSCHTPDLAEVEMGGGEAILLASDGIDVLSDAEVEQVALTEADAARASAAVVRAALSAGAHDNVTAVVLRRL